MGFHKYQKCIDAFVLCAATCNNCASSCLSEMELMVVARCIRLGMECAALCNAAAQLLSLGSTYSKTVCKLCIEACKACANECCLHKNEQCKECADACNHCIATCAIVM